MLSILADENIPAAEQYFVALGTVRRAPGRRLQAADLQGVDVLLVRSVTAVGEALLGDSGVRFVGSATSGVDHIDRDYLQARGIGFAHAPGANANSVVEYVLAAIAACGSRLERLLAGGKLGIVGYGHIGRALAARADALGIEHCVYDPWLDPRIIRRPATLEQVLDCDVVSLHPELTFEHPWPSHHLIDARRLSRLRADALLINASRGAVVDNRALLTQLDTTGGPVAVLDVWEEEPAIHPGLLERATFGTPHIAGYSLDGKLRGTAMLAEAVAAAFGLEWRDPAGSLEALPPLAVPEQLGGADIARFLLSSRYDIRRDDHALREATLGRDPAVAAREFDLLRRNYPVRRELAGTEVYGRSWSAHEQHLLHGLGCITTGGGAGR